ncbi:MAG: DUF402 domain-containing protein [Dehalococcoidia bacterium]|nr:DUF402 domain-containing protein [Dehalococcoidia bacterium]
MVAPGFVGPALEEFSGPGARTRRGRVAAGHAAPDVPRQAPTPSGSSGGEPRRFTTYYVNFEEPFRRTPVGVDTNDHTLDMVVAPDLTWTWKDRDEFEALGVSGHFSIEFSETVEAASREVLELIESGAAPFDGSWVGWAPPSDWTVPVLHPRWQEEPPTPWNRREWAYPLPYR